MGSAGQPWPQQQAVATILLEHHRGKMRQPFLMPCDVGIMMELDLLEGYHQVEIEKDSRKYTTFMNRWGRRKQWKVMFFGVKGAVGWFQLQLEITLRGF